MTYEPYTNYVLVQGTCTLYTNKCENVPVLCTGTCCFHATVVLGSLLYLQICHRESQPDSLTYVLSRSGFRHLAALAEN